MSIGVKEVAYVGYPVTDMARARNFYGRILGLQQSDVLEGENGEPHWVEYDIAGQTLAIAKSSAEWQPGPDGAGISLEVESLEDALSHLAENGIEPAMPIGDFPLCRLTVISDPDGNGIVLHQRKTDHPDFSNS